MMTLVRDTRCNVTDTVGCDVGATPIQSNIPSVWDHDKAGASNFALFQVLWSSELSQLI
jgi:hypothetical protein